MLREFIIGALVYMFLRPLIGPLAYASVTVVALMPLYKKYPRKWFAALLVFATLALLAYVTFIMSITVYDQVEDLATIFQKLTPETQIKLVEWGNNLPLMDFALSTAKSLPSLGVKLIFYIIFSYFLLVDGHKIKDFFYKVLSKRKANRLMKEGWKNLNAVTRGVFMNVFIYIFLSTLVMYFTNCPSPLIYSIIAGVFGILPLLGAPIVYAYLIYLKLLEGSYFAAMILVVFQLSWFFIIDYMIKAKYRGTLHPAILLTSMAAGLYHFGFSGLIIGPLFVTMLITLASVREILF